MCTPYNIFSVYLFFFLICINIYPGTPDLVYKARLINRVLAGL